MNWLEIIQRCFETYRVLFSGHARLEMRHEELGPISEQEVYEAVYNGEVIEEYPDDAPYPSVLVLGMTSLGRPLHLVCAYSGGDNQLVVVTVYQPDSSQWEGFRRRKL